jgi:hypothetical protein
MDKRKLYIILSALQSLQSFPILVNAYGINTNEVDDLIFDLADEFDKAP